MRPKRTATFSFKLDTAVPLAAAGLTARHGRAAADAIVYTAAQTHAADVLTRDRHFATLPGVRSIPKHDS